VWLIVKFWVIMLESSMRELLIIFWMDWMWLAIRLWYILIDWDQLLNKMCLYAWFIEGFFFNKHELFLLRSGFWKYRDDWF